jgi:rhodanese-related sulfurtransferase
MHKANEGQAMYTALIILGALILIALVLRHYLPRMFAGVPFISVQDVRAAQSTGSDMLVLDVREVAEFTGAAGHVPDAINIPLSELNERLVANKAQLEDFKNLPIYVMCQTSARASIGTRTLLDKGFQHIRLMNGGMNAWIKAGYPVAFAESAPESVETETTDATPDGTENTQAAAEQQNSTANTAEPEEDHAGDTQKNNAV